MWRLILLLATAVILPTVCLLWFMTQVVENVRFAAQQKLIDIYQEKLTSASSQLNDSLKAQVELVKANAEVNEIGNFFSFITGKLPGVLIICDKSDRSTHPKAETEDPEPELPKEFEYARKLEFEQKNYEEAKTIYGRIANKAEDDYIWRMAKVAQGRCEVALGRLNSAMKNYYYEAAYSNIDPNLTESSVSLAGRVRLIVAHLEQQLNERSYRWLYTLLHTVVNYNIDAPEFLPLDPATRIFLLEKSVELAEQSLVGYDLDTGKGEDLSTRAISILKFEAKEKKSNEDAHLALSNVKYDMDRRSLVSEILTLEFAEHYVDGGPFIDWTSGSLHRLETERDLYGLYVKKGDKTFLMLQTNDDVQVTFEVFENAFAGDDVSYQILDDNGQSVVGADSVEGEAFLISALGGSMPGWKINLYFADSDVFSNFASRQVAIYVWAGVLVIILILAAGGFAVPDCRQADETQSFEERFYRYGDT
jgi:hypothetical protein